VTEFRSAKWREAPVGESRRIGAGAFWEDRQRLNPTLIVSVDLEKGRELTLRFLIATLGIQMKKGLIAFVILFVVVINGAIFVIDEDSLTILAREDGFFEWASAILYFLSFLFFGWSYWKKHKGNDLILFRTRKNIIFLLLAVIMFLAAGEELSWGQRIFHMKTPSWFENRNIQKETNLHNLDFLQPRDARGKLKEGIAKFTSIPKIFLIFCFGFFCVIPITDRWVPWLSKKYKRLNVPVVPVWIGLLYIINFILFMAIDEFYVVTKSWWMGEISEFNDSFFFFMSSLYFVFAKNGVSVSKDDVTGGISTQDRA